MASNVRSRSSKTEQESNIQAVLGLEQPPTPTALEREPSSLIESSPVHSNFQPRQPPSVESSLLYNGSRSLSGIALQAFSLGLVLSTSIILTIYLQWQSSPLWRLPQFLATLAIFHFLEFYTTARFNTPSAKLSSFLLFSNGAAYNIAHATAMLEIITTSIFFPVWQASLTSPWTIGTGLFLVILGQLVRSTAMAQAGTNFNHIPAREKKDDHVLVTSGVYGYLRHPSYFGFFWWAVGTQVVVGNKICTVAYAVVLWRFFKDRIVAEERFLVEFFGNEYVRFRQRMGTGIPGIR